MNSPTIDDAYYLQAIRKGGVDRERAVKQLLEQYGGYVGKARKSHRISYEAAKDAYVDAIQIVHVHIIDGRFEGRARLSTYLYRIYENLIRAHFRKETSSRAELQRQTLDEDEYPQYLQSPLPTPEKTLVDQDLLEQVRQLLPKVGSNCLKVLLDMVVWGFSAEETAERVGMKNGPTVRVTKHNCISKTVSLIKHHRLAS